MTRAEEKPSAAEEASDPSEPRRRASRVRRKDGSCSSKSPKRDSASATKMATTTIVAVLDCSATWKPWPHHAATTPKRLKAAARDWT